MWVTYHAFLLIAFATHAVVGYALGSVLFGNPKAGVVGALAADLDFLFPAVLGWPFVHRGISHSILVGVLLTVTVAVCYRAVGGKSTGVLSGISARAVGGAFGVAYLSYGPLEVISVCWQHGVPTTGKHLQRSVSHLLIDSTTPKGVSLLSPLVDHSFYLDFPTTGHSPLPTVILCFVSLGILLLQRGDIHSTVRNVLRDRN